MNAGVSVRIRNNLALHAVLVLCAAVVLVPTFWVIAAGFRTQISLLIGEVLFKPTLASFTEVLFSKTSDFLLNARNSIIVGLLSTAICLAVATLGAWSLHAMRWPRWTVHGFLGWTMLFQMTPPLALGSAWYSMARLIGLDNTLTGLVLAHLTLNLPMALWLIGVFIREVPRELEEAARLDGASTPVMLWHVVLPIIAPGLAAAAVLSFIFSWNEFAIALNLTLRQTATVPVAISKFAQEFQTDYTQMAAASALSMLPALLLLLIAQRYIVSGLTQGAVR